MSGVGALRATRVNRLAEVDAVEWDRLVPRDLPHLRHGFLLAVEASGLGKNPQYLRAWRGDRLIGVTVAYVLPIDLLTLVPQKYTRWIDAVRNRIAPRLLYINTIIGGPPITNCHHNFCLAADLSPDQQQEAIATLAAELEAIPEGSAFSLFEFTEESADLYWPELEKRGFIKAHSLPGTRMNVHWGSLDEYIASMRKAFRRTVLKDRRAAEGIAFEIVEEFSDLADEAWALYKNVLAKAEYVLEELTPEFFRELGKIEQSRLVTARDLETGRLIGIELLLCGDTILQDLYTGLDYRYNDEQRLYFNLLYPVIGYAGENRFQTLYLGQTSYTFKARLGVTPYPLRVFVKHRNPRVHRFLARFKALLFPETRPPTFRVFREAESVVEKTD